MQRCQAGRLSFKTVTSFNLDEYIFPVRSPACPRRMRPVLMTSLTVILAMLPAAIGAGAGSGQYGPLAVAVIGGILWSTLLTLVVVPVAYALLERWLAAGEKIVNGDHEAGKKRELLSGSMKEADIQRWGEALYHSLRAARAWHH